MSKEDLINNLGTSARSGSQEFVQNNKDVNDKIIGQFGVGFYSSFIVGDSVEVISKIEGQDHAHIWVSDGSGDFEISKI